MPLKLVNAFKNGMKLKNEFIIFNRGFFKFDRDAANECNQMI